MLKELLKTLAEGQALNAVQVARQLDVTQGLVVQMLEDLEQRGYVEHLQLGCDAGKCSGCAQAASCQTLPKLSGWTLMDKGRTAAQAKG